MKNAAFKLFLAIAVIIQFSYSAFAEFVFLKDGSIIEGKILSDTADTLTLKDKEGRTREIPRGRVMRTLYTNLNMSKLFIQKRNGESFVAYLVDEDRDDYLFRYELYKAEEFKVSRKEILFMAEKNPSALKGEPASDSIKLSWLPPYGQVKTYKIYMKMKKGDEYKVVGSTRKTEITLTGLTTQTTYFFIVRAIDDTDYETNPSNEIQVITKSTLPESPEVRVERDANDNWVLVWTEAKDEDGKIEGYRIYSEKDGKYALLEETKKLTAIVPYDAIFDSVHVRSFDNNGDESAPDDYRNEWRIMLSPQFIMPMGKTTDFAGMGYGADIDVSRRDMLFSDSEFGFTTGYLMVEGKQKIGDDNSNVTSLNMYPAALFFGYRIPLIFDMFNHYDVLALVPRVSAGLLVMQMDYELLDNGGNVTASKSAVILEPFVKAGLLAEVGISRHFFITAGCEYIYMIDSVQGLGMINFSASAGTRF